MNKDSLSRMRGRPAAAVIGVLLALAPSTARAEDASLTLETAVRLALTRNERALAADAEVRAAEARVTRARSFFLPTLTSTGTYTRRPFEVSRKVGDTNIVIQSYNAIAGVAQVNMTLFDATSLPAPPPGELRARRPAFRLGREPPPAVLRSQQRLPGHAGHGPGPGGVPEPFRIRPAVPGGRESPVCRRAGLGQRRDPGRARSTPPRRWASSRSKGRSRRPISSWGILLDDPEAARKKLIIPEFLLQAAEGGPASRRADDRRGPGPAARPGVPALSCQGPARPGSSNRRLSWLPSLSFNGQYRYTNEVGSDRAHHELERWV